MESYLLISGLQHFIFCPRQWGLIHIEQQWAENFFTAEGKVLHDRAFCTIEFTTETLPIRGEMSCR